MRQFIILYGNLKKDNLKMNYQLIPINTHKTAESGDLSVFESLHDIPFEIKRIYYISNVRSGIRRGAHAHKSLKQFMFCPYGSITITLDDGYSSTDIILDDPSVGLLVFPCMWRDMIWNTDNSVLCVAASEYYDEADYIRDREEFLQYIHSSDRSGDIK